MRNATIALACFSLLLLPGCLTSSQTNGLQADIDAMQAQLLQLQREHASLQDGMDAQAEKVATALQDRDETRRIDQADLTVEVESLSVEMDILGEKLDDTNFRLSTLITEIQAARETWSRPPVGVTPGATMGPGADSGAPPGLAPSLSSGAVAAPMIGGASPDEIFNTAYADYTKGNYPLAILGFQEYLEKFPRTEFADDSLYWVGESYYSQGKFNDAVEAFGEVIRRYPDGDKIAGSHLKRGYAFLESNQMAQGVVQLNALIETFPGSDEARLAAQRLRALGLRG